MPDQSLKPARDPPSPSKLMSWSTMALLLGFQSITASGLMLSMRPIAPGAGFGNSAPLQNFLAGVTPGILPRSASGAYHEVRYGVANARFVNDFSLSIVSFCDEKPTFGTPNTSTSPRNWNM